MVWPRHVTLPRHCLLKLALSVFYAILLFDVARALAVLGEQADGCTSVTPSHHQKYHRSDLSQP